MDTVLLSIILLLCFTLFIFITTLPIRITKLRGVSDEELTTIAILSWCGVIFFAITWIIALILSLVYKPKNWVDKEDLQLLDSNNLEILEKLSNLKDKGIISEDQFSKEKQKLLKNI
ncbi:MAG: SHOCT domain-containing protein [Alphaproteobacteria bacterium]|nr:SHOCT domain-containing protein [Alphaproteobacteria bacterium]